MKEAIWTATQEKEIEKKEALTCTGIDFEKVRNCYVVSHEIIDSAENVVVYVDKLNFKLDFEKGN